MSHTQRLGLKTQGTLTESGIRPRFCLVAIYPPKKKKKKKITLSIVVKNKLVVNLSFPLALHIFSYYCMCRSGVAAAAVDSRAADAPQPRVLGWTRHILGLAADIWVPGLLCWNDVKPLLLACNSLCCPGSSLDDWSAPQTAPQTNLSNLITTLASCTRAVHKGCT